MQAQGIKSIKRIGFQETLDLTVDSPDHNFYAEGVVTSNSHSCATAYLSALTVYLKYKYPLQFYTSCLRSTKNLPTPLEDIAAIQKELAFFNIKLLAPDILKSHTDFDIEDGNIRFGISSIKGISENTLAKFAQFKKAYDSKFDFFDAAKNAGLSIGVVSALIQSGCISFPGVSRPLLVLEAQTYNILTDKEKRTVKLFEKEYNSALLKIIKDISTRKDEDGKPLLKETRFETIKKKYEPYKAIYNQNSSNSKFASWFYETYLLGFSYSYTLRDIFKEYVENLVSVSEAKNSQKEDKVKVACVIDEIVLSKSKKGTKYYKASISDETGKHTLFMFEQVFDKIKEKNGRMPAEKDVIIFNGVNKGDTFFTEDIWIQNDKIYMKASELKE